ncbi:DUF1501 domain-containing protein [Pontiella agarivorans]|uniref:DUF1501 domain-containing protein n=1 Tax=Pontiella agarivorans TaxID=3038953 RepID=A0ABU5MYC9_9BACT|nr:DUF1501 domain-containing protein [Pontiella agarivorans]MDZ8119214.1 DUF1501 domain-containing protein [Pontiella agarivorans]
MSRTFTRRRVLGEVSCAGIGTATLMSSLINLKLAGNAAADALLPGNDRKTVVNVLLAGGCDTFNLLLRRDSGYAEYAASRSSLALPNDASLHPLTQISGNDGNLYALHPSCAGLADLFNGAGDFPGTPRLAFITNVGTLVEPTTLSDYLSASVVLPKSLFSHIDQIEQWQTSVPQGMAELRGWGGRMADVLHSAANTGATAMSISLAGNNIYQIGDSTKQMAITRNGALLFESEWDWTQEHHLKNEGLMSLVELQNRHLMRDSFSRHTKESIEAQQAFKVHWDVVEPGFDGLLTDASFPDTYFGKNLRAAAITIKIRADLGLRRNSIFINFGGWDHHGELLNTQAGMLTDLSEGLYQFQLALEELGLAQDVVTFTSSDFGRTLRSNGRGSDHAWGGNAMVMGEPVAGGKVYGTFPSLAIDGADDVGKGGRILPSTSVDVFFAEIARWFGVSATDLPYVLPNIENFIDPVSASQPVGFIKSGRIV